MDAQEILLAAATTVERDAKKKKTRVTVASTNLDLEAYANNYQGPLHRSDLFPMVLGLMAFHRINPPPSLV